MKLYLAASYSRRLEIADYAELLIQDGHLITASWLSGQAEYENWSEQRCAVQDLLDIEASEGLVQFTSGKPSRGGSQVEFGYALKLLSLVAIVGPREHVFHHIPGVDVYDNIEDLRLGLKLEQ